MKLVSYKTFKVWFKELPSPLYSLHSCVFRPAGIHTLKGSQYSCYDTGCSNTWHLGPPFATWNLYFGFLDWSRFPDSVNHQIYWSLLWKTFVSQSSKLVNKKSRLQLVLKHYINFSELEYLPLCDIYNLKLSLGVWSLELFLYKKQKRVFLSWKGFLSTGKRCLAEGASVRLVETWTYNRFKPISPFAARSLVILCLSRLLFPFFIAEICWPEGNKEDSGLGHSSRNGKSVLCFLL